MYLEAVAIPRAIGSRKPSLSRTVWTKLAPTSPVTTTTAAVRDVFAPETNTRQLSSYKLLQLVTPGPVCVSDHKFSTFKERYNAESKCHGYASG